MSGQAITIPTVDAHTVKAWLDQGEAVLIDVREPAEHASERIAGAKLAPLSGLDQRSLPGDGAKRIVLHCASGARSTEAFRKLVGRVPVEMVQLEGGLAAWKRLGLPVESGARRYVSIQRQVQMVVGAMALIGTALGATMSPWFLVLPGFAGAGLLFAGLSGTCAMAGLLARLPYNQRVW
jgi:rhodanese-related sulfurtransferase